MKKTTMTVIMITALLLLALTGCSTAETEPTDSPVEEPSVESPSVEEPQADLDLSGIKWSLVHMGKSNLIEGSEITAEFMDGQINGNAGCNQYFGEFTLDGKSVSTGMVGSTEMACMEPDGVMDQETRFLGFLSEVVEADIVDGQLTLTKADGDSLIFVPWTEAEPTSLENTIWELKYIGEAVEDGDAVSFSEYAVLNGSLIQAEFEDGKIFGTAGCNTYNAEVTFDGWNMAVGPAASTRMFCGEPEGLMDQEAKYLEILGGVESYMVDAEGILILTGTNGSRLMFASNAEPEEGQGMKPMNIHGTNWKLVDLSGNPLVEGTEITALFVEEKISGSSGCNTYNSDYSVEGSRLSFGMAISTMMFCDQPEGTMDQEAAYLAALAEVVVFRIDDGLLILGTPDIDLLVFEQVGE